MNKKVIIGAVASVAFLAGCGCSTPEQESVPIEPEMPVVDEGVQENGVPEGCVTWFDGCNTCGVNVENPDGPMACTMMACAVRQEPYCMKYEDGSSDAPIESVSVSTEVEEGIKNSTYKIGSEEVTLVDGKAEEEAAPGSATKIITQTTDFMAEGDLQQGTGATLDGTVVLVQDPGGSGTFYYIGATIQQPDGTYTAALDTHLLGDRVVIKELKVDGRMIYVTYLTRTDDEPMSAEPTVEVTKQYATKGVGTTDLVLMDVTPSDTTQAQDTTTGEEQMVGNDKDEHGCIGSAGYAWNEQTQKCERPWEEN
ncbi:MAG: hypothetical protein U9Q12_02905 [Patescibacteria group bacterium]|nr:hypothetical protein [Patescibacteria group bacterium]